MFLFVFVVDVALHVGAGSIMNMSMVMRMRMMMSLRRKLRSPQPKSKRPSKVDDWMEVFSYEWKSNFNMDNKKICSSLSIFLDFKDLYRVNAFEGKHFALRIVIKKEKFAKTQF
jgi:hypothetical protein